MTDETITKEKSDLLVHGVREALARALEAGLPLTYARNVLDWEAARARQFSREALLVPKPIPVVTPTQFPRILDQFPRILNTSTRKVVPGSPR